MVARAERGIFVPSYEIIHPDGPIISVFQTPEETRNGLIAPVLSVISQWPGSLGLLATGESYRKFYKPLVDTAKEYDIDLASLIWSHLDNYVWHSKQYPKGRGPEDFGDLIRTWFIDPAGIPAERYHPINGETDNPMFTALTHGAWLNAQTISFALYGLGPPPEVHAGYMRENTPEDLGFHWVHLSPSVVARNKARGENTPDEGLTIGPDTIKRVLHNFVLATGKPEEVERVLVFPRSPAINGSIFRSPDVKNVRFFIDEASAAPLKHLPRVPSKGV